MDGFDGGTRGYWKNRYYTRLDADVHDGQDHLHGGAAAKPPSGRRRKPPSTRRPKVVKVAPPPRPPPPSAEPFSSTAQPEAPAPGAAPTFSVRRRRRFWRIRLTPRLAFLRRVAWAPARFLRGLQKGYVRMMLRFAGAMGVAGAPGMGGYPMIPRPALKEYDEKVLVEIYRALVAQGQVLVVPADGGGIAAATLVAR